MRVGGQQSCTLWHSTQQQRDDHDDDDDYYYGVMSRRTGVVLITVSSVAFAYVTVWLLVVPFLEQSDDDDNGANGLHLQSLFLDPTYAFVAAAAVLCAVLVVAGLVVAGALIGSNEQDLSVYSKWQFKPTVRGHHHKKQ